MFVFFNWAEERRGSLLRIDRSTDAAGGSRVRRARDGRLSWSQHSTSRRQKNGKETKRGIIFKGSTERERDFDFDFDFLLKRTRVGLGGDGGARSPQARVIPFGEARRSPPGGVRA